MILTAQLKSGTASTSAPKPSAHTPKQHGPAHRHSEDKGHQAHAMLMKTASQSLTEQLSARFAERIRIRIRIRARLDQVRACPPVFSTTHFVL